MLQHHLVILSTNAGDLVSTEGRARRVEVTAVRPHSSSLDTATHAIGQVPVARPYARAQSVERVVGDLERLRFVLEGRHRQDRSEDLFLDCLLYTSPSPRDRQKS